MGRSGLFFMVISLILFILGVDFCLGGSMVLVSYSFGLLGGVPLGVEVVMDWISLIFYSVVLLISGLIMFYSVGYMGEDKTKDRFVYLMVGFVLSMGLVVFSSNLIMLLFGWDGLGLVSYCLVIYYQNARSFNAGMMTILSNRIGDVGLLGALGLMMSLSSLGYVWYPYLGGEWSLGVVMVGLMVLAGMTKSAQLPFSAWLPAAMAAPTPVSSLVHSSTLVAAGVFLMIRLSLGLGQGGFYLFFVGVMTMLMAGLGANFEKDFSSVVALSTLSQLGVMMMIVSVGQWELAFLHMVVHALFKAMMFMCAGSIIHGGGGNQDMRFLGGMIVCSPFVGSSLFVATMALMGFPFLAGFYSKDLILEWVVSWDCGFFALIIVFFAFVLTVGYSVKMGYYSMWGGLEGSGMSNASEDNAMNLAIVGLVFFSVFGGAMMGWLLLPYDVLMILSGAESLVGILIVLVGLWVFLGGVSLSLGCTSGSALGVVGDFSGGMWFIGWLSGNPIVGFLKLVSFFKSGDEVWGEVIGGSGAGILFMSGSGLIESVQGMTVKDYFVLLWLMFLFMMLL